MKNSKTKMYFSKQEIIKRFLDIRFREIQKETEYGSGYHYSENWDCLKDITNELNSLTDMELVRKVIEEGYNFTKGGYEWDDYSKSRFYQEMCKFLLEELDKKS